MNKKQELEILLKLDGDSKFSELVLCNKETETTVSIANNVLMEDLAIDEGLTYETIKGKKHFKKSDLVKIFINIITIKTI